MGTIGSGIRFLGCVLLGVIAAEPAAFPAMNPCAGVRRSLGAEEKTAIQASLADLLDNHRIAIADSMAIDGWAALWVDTPDEETSVFFFHVDPRATPFVAVWGGAAAPGAEPANTAWAHAYVPGIPDSLASCFAWRVSPEGIAAASQSGRPSTKGPAR